MEWTICARHRHVSLACPRRRRCSEFIVVMSRASRCGGRVRPRGHALMSVCVRASVSACLVCLCMDLFKSPISEFDIFVHIAGSNNLYYHHHPPKKSVLSPPQKSVSSSPPNTLDPCSSGGGRSVPQDEIHRRHPDTGSYCGKHPHQACIHLHDHPDPHPHPTSTRN